MTQAACRGRNDCWGKILLFCTTLLLVAPCFLHSLFHLAHPHMHGPGLPPPHHHGGPHGQHHLPEKGAGFGGPREEGLFPRRHTRPDMLGGGGGELESPKASMPPMFHHEFHRVACILATLCLATSFLAPSKCRGRLGLAVMISLVFVFPLPLLTLARHADARQDFCQEVSTRSVQNYYVMSVSIGPFEAMSVVRGDVTRKVDADAMLECDQAIERRVKFIGTILWLIFMTLFTAVSGLTLSDCKQFRNQKKCSGEEEGPGAALIAEEDKNMSVAETMVVAYPTVPATTAAAAIHTGTSFFEEGDSACVVTAEGSPVQPLVRNETIPYLDELHEDPKQE